MLCGKDRCKSVREVIHNYCGCLLQNNAELCICEKAFFDWLMKIYPCNLKTQVRLINFQIELLMILLQCKVFSHRFVPWYHENKALIQKSVRSEHFRQKLV